MQWHQLDHMQTICTSLQTDNHTNTSSLNFLQAGFSPWCVQFVGVNMDWQVSAVCVCVCACVRVCVCVCVWSDVNTANHELQSFLDVQSAFMWEIMQLAFHAFCPWCAAAQLYMPMLAPSIHPCNRCLAFCDLLLRLLLLCLFVAICWWCYCCKWQ